MPDERQIDSPPDADWREVWKDDGRHATGGVLRRLSRRISLLVRRQREFNLVLLDLLRDLRRDLEGIRNDFKAQADDIIRDLRAVNADLSRDIGDVDGRIYKGVARGDALVSVLDRKIEGLSARIRDLSNPQIGGDRPPLHQTDFVYRRMEDALRGSEVEVREAAGHYLRFARESGPVIDVGCGRGEFLQLCRDEGINATGFDSNERAIADLVARGFDARLGLIPGCFVGIEDRSVGTIVAMHVVEHLPFDVLFSLLTESARVLKGGGYLAIETPNADSIVSSAAEFWKDPTHLGPRHQAGLVTLAREIGFDVAELATTAPFAQADRIQVPQGASADVADLVTKLNELLYGDQNLRLVLRVRSA